MPPHWWIPVKGSDPETRKGEVQEIIEKAGGTLEGFWRDDDGKRLYALAMEVDLPPARLEELKVDGQPTKLHTKPLKKV